jgi:hypothetical protein
MDGFNHTCKEKDIKKCEDEQQRQRDLIKLVDKEYEYSYQNNPVFSEAINALIRSGVSINGMANILYLLCEKINPCIPQ